MPSRSASAIARSAHFVACRRAARAACRNKHDRNQTKSPWMLGRFPISLAFPRSRGGPQACSRSGLFVDSCLRWVLVARRSGQHTHSAWCRCAYTCALAAVRSGVVYFAPHQAQQVDCTHEKVRWLPAQALGARRGQQTHEKLRRQCRGVGRQRKSKRLTQLQCGLLSKACDLQDKNQGLRA